MERIENLTIEKLDKLSSEASDYKETQSVENVPVGALSMHPIVEKINGKLSPNYALIKFERKNKEGEELKLKFSAVKVNILHISTGKTYNDMFVKLTEGLRDALNDKANWSKELIGESVEYVDGMGRKRTMCKFESITK